VKAVTLPRGVGFIEAELPDHAHIFSIVESTHEPRQIDNIKATRDALDDPLDYEPIEDLVGPGSRVALVFPDRVKGGRHDLAHRKVALPQILERLDRAGVRESDIFPICAIGLHRKNSDAQMLEYLPPVMFERFSRIPNHDAEDPEGVVHLGHTDRGDLVDFNRTCAEADLTIMLGHVQGNPYGGFSGGYKTCTTGLTTWRSIAAHHVPGTMHRPDFVPISTDSQFRSQLTEIGRKINRSLPHRIFACDSVIGKGSKVLGTWAGDVEAVERASWPLARRRTNVELDIDPADVLVFGLPMDFHYGPGMGTNPILMSQAIAAVIARVAGAFRRGGVAIVVAECNGWFNEEWFPSYPATFDRFVERGSIENLLGDVEEFATDRRWIDAYRSQGAYHPFHAFSMLSMAAIGHRLAGSIIIVGADRPDIAENAGFETAPDIASALHLARAFVGADPSILALPDFLFNVPPHLFSRGG
jgi:nickel-dependent lactate racemase